MQGWVLVLLGFLGEPTVCWLTGSQRNFRRMEVTSVGEQSCWSGLRALEARPV